METACKYRPLSIYLPTYLSIYLFICLSMCLYIYLCICMYRNLHLHPLAVQLQATGFSGEAFNPSLIQMSLSGNVTFPLSIGLLQGYVQEQMILGPPSAAS